MRAAKNKGLEVHCPVCHKLFPSEEEMLEHYDATHAGKESVTETGEKVTGALLVSETSFVGGENFYLILATTKVLSAKVKPSITALLSPFLGTIPSLVLFGRTKPHVGKETDVLTTSMEKTVLEDDPQNFVVPYSEIRTIELKKHKRFSTGEIHIVTADGKSRNFRLVMLASARDDTFNTYRGLLETALPEKLSIVE